MNILGFLGGRWSADNIALCGQFTVLPTLSVTNVQVDEGERDQRRNVEGFASTNELSKGHKIAEFTTDFADFFVVMKKRMAA